MKKVLLGSLIAIALVAVVVGGYFMFFGKGVLDRSGDLEMADRSDVCDSIYEEFFSLDSGMDRSAFYDSLIQPILDDAAPGEIRSIDEACAYAAGRFVSAQNRETTGYDPGFDDAHVERVVLTMASYIGKERANEIIGALMREDSVKSIESAATGVIFLTVPRVVACLESGGRLEDPQFSQLICKNSGSDDKWPNLEEYDGEWGGCEFIVDRNDEEFDFQYCAKLFTDKVLRCTIEGCELYTD